MGMNYVDRGTSKNIYFTPEDNKKCIEILREWSPRRKAAILEGKIQSCPVPEFVGKHIYSICNNISFRYNFRGFPYREEMVSDAVLNIVRYLHGFDPDRIGERSQKVNFYAWVTMCANRSFGNKINSEKREEYFKYAMFEEMGGYSAFGEEHEAMGESPLTSDMAQDFISRARQYEEKEREKSKKPQPVDIFEELEKQLEVKKTGVLRFLK